MKHFILILASIVFSTGLSLAQTQDSTSAVLRENLPETQMTKKEIRKAAMPEQRNEITVSYGRATVMDVAYLFANALASAFTFGNVKIDNYHANGSVNAEYYRVLSKTFSVGGQFSWSGGKADLLNKENVKTGTSNYSAFTMMPSAKAFWFRKKHVAMYSKLGLGVTLLDGFSDDTEDRNYSPFFAAQLGAVCIQAGGKHVRGFLEAGGGMAGCITGGLSISF